VAITIAAAAFWYSRYFRGRENSIEYHTASYLAERDGMPMVNRVRGLLRKITGRKMYRDISAKKMRAHRDALLRLGYWEEKVFVISNLDAVTVWGSSRNKAAKTHLTNEIWELAVTGSNWTAITVHARPIDMPVWERLIRDADAPRPQPQVIRQTIIR
jgi:hypothetical protein